MKWISAVALVLVGIGLTNPAQSANAVCVVNPPLNELTRSEGIAVKRALGAHAKSLCNSDMCEFRVRQLDDGNTLVRIRATRYAAPLKQCVTVFMGQAGEVFDTAGNHVDRWPYCVTMARELEHDPMFEPDPSFSACGRPRR